MTKGACSGFLNNDLTVQAGVIDSANMYKDNGEGHTYNDRVWGNDSLNNDLTAQACAMTMYKGKHSKTTPIWIEAVDQSNGETKM